jgi:hypothetical protein
MLRQNVVACTTAFKSSLVASGLPETLFKQCKLSPFLPLLGQRCNNHTTVPQEYQQMADAVCASGKCNKGADCTDLGKQIILELAGPYADQATISFCGVFLFMSFPSQRYGAQGALDFTNCYWDIPPALEVHYLQPAKSPSSGHGHTARLIGVTCALIAGILVLVCHPLPFALASTKTFHQGHKHRKLFQSKMSKGQGLDPLQWYSLSEVRGATHNFAPKQLLGKGGSGKMYLGQLSDGTQVAVI